MSLDTRLIVSRPLYLKEDASSCGYCHGVKENRNNYFSLSSWYDAEQQKDIQINHCTLGFQVENMTVDQYDKLCNMGYRRSGNFLYKGDLLRNCCKFYTIRTTPKDVEITKELRKCINRFKKKIAPTTHHPKQKEPYNFVKEIVEAEKQSSNFHTTFEPASYSEEKYQLYAKFQEKIHNDFKHNPKSFERFLCHSPFSETVDHWKQLNNWKNFETGDKLQHMGATHECYYFENRLIAFAVTDFLPTGISSVYFVWDPDYAKWSLGKISALRELAILQMTNRDYYYLGYYIDDCPKMSYKAKYGGALLDVCSHSYVPLGKLKAMHYIDYGKLFTLESGTTTLSVKLNNNAPLITELGPNTIEKLYGAKTGTEFADSRYAVKELKDKYGISYPDEPSSIYEPKSTNSTTTSRESMYDIPTTMPGLLPLRELVHIIASGEIEHLNNTLIIYSTSTGQLRPLHRFQDESEPVKKAVCDIVRAVGIELAKQSLVIV